MGVLAPNLAFCGQLPPCPFGVMPFVIYHYCAINSSMYGTDNHNVGFVLQSWEIVQEFTTVPGVWSPCLML